jgi:lysozyme
MAKAAELAGELLEADPMARPAPAAISHKQRAGALILAACVVCAPLTAGREGFIAKAEPDPIGIPTGCYGERVDQSDLDPSKIYTRGECMERLRIRLANDYAPKIAACRPELLEADRRNEFAALIDTSFNAGPVAVCNSPMAANIKAGKWAAACEAIKSFRVGSVTARPVRGAMESRRITSGPNKGKWFNKFRGLVDRRAFFAGFCMKPEA